MIIIDTNVVCTPHARTVPLVAGSPYSGRRSSPSNEPISRTLSNAPHRLRCQSLPPRPPAHCNLDGARLRSLPVGR